MDSGQAFIQWNNEHPEAVQTQEVVAIHQDFDQENAAEKMLALLLPWHKSIKHGSSWQ